MKNIKKEYYIIAFLAGILILLLYFYFKKPNVSQEKKVVIVNETKKIDSLTILIKYRDQIIQNQKDNFIKLSKQKNKVRKEYRDRLVTGIDTTCEKYVSILEQENDSCHTIVDNQDKQIQDLKSRDTSRIIITQTLYKEIKIRDRKLFSGTLGGGLNYGIEQKFTPGLQFTVGIILFRF